MNGGHFALTAQVSGRMRVVNIHWTPALQYRAIFVVPLSANNLSLPQPPAAPRDPAALLH